MFTQRRSFFKGKLFYIILLALFGFGLWLNQAPAVQDSPNEVNAGTNYPTTADDSANQGNNGDSGTVANSRSNDIMDSIAGSNQTVTPANIETGETTANPGEAANTGYYLVKEVGGIIKIFYYNEEGKESLIGETDIAFSLLSAADQSLFQKGVIRHTQEELNELLQDFES